MIEIRLVGTDGDILDCFDVMVQLHDKLQRDSFTDYVRRLESKGYRLACLYDDGRARSVAGFHLNESFAWKQYLYVADLVTGAEFRSRGYGERLVQWLLDYAKENGCAQVHLDSRVIRHATHKFYLNQGFILGGYHFHKTLDGTTL